ncbi:MAG: hypothetical protein LBE35_08525 [Clostridiales bacterium]|nr:hypothetical protein [Clostridiales bacterium]
MKKFIAAVLMAFVAVFSMALVAFADISVSVDGEMVVFEDQQPIVVEGRTLLPLRGVAEKLGYEVGWDEASQTATVEGRGFDVHIPLGSYSFTVNGEEMALDVPATLYGGRTMLPIRAVLEALGHYVRWNESAQQVMVISSMIISAEHLKALIDSGYDNLVILGVAHEFNQTIADSFIFTQADYTMRGGPYSSGADIPNMRRPLAEMEALLSRAGINADSLVVAYTNTPNQGARLVWELTVLGLDALSLDGGIVGWVEAGLPTGPATNLVTAPPISEFRAINYRNDEMNVGISGMLHALQNPDEWVILDVRAPGEYEGITGACDHGFVGRIANSVNIEWTNANVPGTGNRQVRPEAEIREIFAPAFDGRNVIIYCRGGVRATHTWMVLYNLGVDAYVFLGSWNEWGYALDPESNHPDAELVLQFTEALSRSDEFFRGH